MEKLESINMLMKNHEQARVFERRAKMREIIECVLP